MDVVLALTFTLRVGQGLRRQMLGNIFWQWVTFNHISVLDFTSVFLSWHSDCLRFILSNKYCLHFIVRFILHYCILEYHVHYVCYEYHALKMSTWILHLLPFLIYMWINWVLHELMICVMHVNRRGKTDKYANSFVIHYLYNKTF